MRMLVIPKRNSFLIALLLILFGCNTKKEDCHYYVTIKNNTGSDIYFYLQFNYPDTSIDSYNPIGSPYDYKIAANNEKQASVGRNHCYEGFFKLNPTLEYFLFDANTLMTVPWDTIRRKYLILKRYDLTLNDLQSMNWRITYP
jgi:hypothetical protein